jgi:hypothetical protein
VKSFFSLEAQKQKDGSRKGLNGFEGGALSEFDCFG